MGKTKGKPTVGQSADVSTTNAEVSALSTLTASSKAVDQSLASLFGSSLGPVKAPQRTYLSTTLNNPVIDQESNSSVIGDDHNTAGGVGTQGDYQTIMQPRSRREDSYSKAPLANETEIKRRRKRKRMDDDLEEKYMQSLRIQGDDGNERQNGSILREEDGANADGTNGGTTTVGNPRGVASKKLEDSGGEGESDSESESTHEGVASNPTSAGVISPDFPIRHEALEQRDSEDLETAARTVFLGNVPSIAISSKSSYKILKSRFSAPGKVLKIRFRSVAFSEQIPRKAAFVKHKLHEKQQTVNAYLVYETKEAARGALKLNGTVVLDRHIRVDSVAHPAKHDTHRSVFIGNLDFEAQEEGLWRHFGSCGTIEYVRVVRDCATNVGKGFAYVQFEDVVSVEQALLLDGKKMGSGRILRVSRAKNIKRKSKPIDQASGPHSKKQKLTASQAGPRQREMLGRARKLLGKAGAAKIKKAPAHSTLIFEGTRATQKLDPGIKLGSRRKGKPSKARATTRSSAWKKRSK